MMHARVIAAAATKSLKTFGELVKIILNRILSLSRNSERSDIVFDMYYGSSVKAGERLRQHDCFT